MQPDLSAPPSGQQWTHSSMSQSSNNGIFSNKNFIGTKINLMLSPLIPLCCRDVETENWAYGSEQDSQALVSAEGFHRE